MYFFVRYFLLNRSTEEDLTEKSYDLDGDDIWTVFDLCLMKHYIFQSMQPPAEKNNDILVAYFSRTCTTKQVAEYIIDITGAESFEIEAAVPYTDEDIQYSNSSCRANQEQNDQSVRPEIAGSIENMEHYDTIFVGYPIWWGQEPRIIDTFLESYDFSDKTVIRSVYEDKVQNRIPEEICVKLLGEYQQELQTVETAIMDMHHKIAESKQDERDVDELIRHLKSYAGAETLTRQMCLDLIEYVTIDENPHRRKGANRVIHIYYKLLDSNSSKNL